MANQKHNSEPCRFELFLLQDGEQKIEETPFAAMANCSDFLVRKEDHTIGNLLAEQLKRHPKVLMAAYKIAHPNVPELQLRVQTDGSISPKDAIIDVCKNLIGIYSQIGREFTREFELRRMVAAGEQKQQDGAGQGGGAGAA